MTSTLSPSTRKDAIAAATTGTYDLVVVGGGVTGAGVALDAASRGLSVVLLEAGDLAVGTSSRSGKTMHGGLRYLEQLNFSLVFGALRERDLTIKTLAPHLVGHEHFLYPLQHQWEKPYVGAGVGLYDAMATMSKRTGGAPHARYLSRKTVEREAPGLDTNVVIAGLQYPDGRMDDARHTLAVARTAASYGAQVITYAKVTGVRTAPDGRATGVTVEDVQGGGSFDVSARVVVNAAGVWAAEIQQLAGAHTFSIAPAKGVHLLVRKEAFDSTTGILSKAEDSVIILRKWYGHWLLGTTDTPYERRQEQPDGREGGHRLPAAQRQQAAAPQDRALRPAGHLRRAAPAARPRGSRREVDLRPVPRPRRDRGADGHGDASSGASTRPTGPWPATPSTPRPSRWGARSRPPRPRTCRWSGRRGGR